MRAVFLGNIACLSADAKKALAHGKPIFNDFADDDYALAIDGLFGIGLARPLDDTYKETVHRLNALSCPVLSIDIPSGINGDTGAAAGKAVYATRTITFFAAKLGLYTGDGAQAAGKVVVERLNFQGNATPCGFLLNDDDDLNLRQLQRHKNTHKGNYGTLAVIGGATGMVGASVLATRAAVRLGAGKVFALSLANPVPLLDWSMPEVMWCTATADILKTLSLQAGVIGVGMGTDSAAKRLLKTALTLPLPLVVDADALNLLAQHLPLRNLCTNRKAPLILTPHPTEAARMLGSDTIAVNKDRVHAAKTLAANYSACVILKGAGTVIADSSGWCICAAGNPGLAQAGAGDVLAGIIGALLAQTQNAEFAARAGVWLHAAAADEQAAQSGTIGLNLNTLAETAARRLNLYIENQVGD